MVFSSLKISSTTLVLKLFVYVFLILLLYTLNKAYFLSEFLWPLYYFISLIRKTMENYKAGPTNKFNGRKKAAPDEEYVSDPRPAGAVY